MVSRLAYAGLVILLIGTAVGFVGASYPSSSQAQRAVSLINTPFSVDRNDYATQNLAMHTGQAVNISVSIQNDTVFTFDVMNQTQYYIWYSCAPKCHQPLLGGNGTFYEQLNESAPWLLNATVTPSAPYRASFLAPSNGTYYFVFDNSIGADWANYLGQNASGFTSGAFSLTQLELVKSDSVNWIIILPGCAAILVGGAIATIFWNARRRLRIPR